MQKEELKNWILSEYNENTEDQLDYYINGMKCQVGDKAYLYDHAENELIEMEITYIVHRKHDLPYYDELIQDDDVLIKNEDVYGADTAAEFITDDDCCLVWFKYV